MHQRALPTWLLLLLTLAGCATRVAGPATPHDPDLIQVMILPTYHMDPQGADVVNIEAADVRTPVRQRELNQLARALSTFEPTAIAVEREGQAPDYLDTVFPDFMCDRLLESKNERTQIAYRLARGLSLSRVYAIDEQPDEHEPDYFPLNKVMSAAATQGQDDQLNAVFAELRTKANAFADRQAATSVPDMLIDLATGDLVKPNLYYNLIAFDHGESQPASELHAYWFMRNAKIFSKLYQVAEPGDRIIVVYGAGHHYWLDHLVKRTAGFASVEVLPYLNAAKTADSAAFCTDE